MTARDADQTNPLSKASSSSRPSRRAACVSSGTSRSVRNWPSNHTRADKSTHSATAGVTSVDSGADAASRHASSSDTLNHCLRREGKTWLASSSAAAPTSLTNRSSKASHLPSRKRSPHTPRMQ